MLYIAQKLKSAEYKESKQITITDRSNDFSQYISKCLSVKLHKFE